MSKKKFILPKDLKELGALLNGWSQKGKNLSSKL